MAKKTDKFASIEDGTLTLGQPGNYTFDFSGGSVVVSRGGGTSFTDASFAGITNIDFGNANKINLTGLNFTDASQAANNKFEPDSPTDALIKGLLADYGVAGTLDLVSVNGGKAGTFQLIWDYLDDNYSYYNAEINADFVRLGVAYAEYLQNGGTPLTDVIAKYTPDGGDAGTAPDRLQSMHDNLLGNVNVNAIIDRFFDSNPLNGAPNLPPGSGYDPNGDGVTVDETLGNVLLDLVFAAGLDGRPYYSGNEGASNAATIAWDQQHNLIA